MPPIQTSIHHFGLHRARNTRNVSTSTTSPFFLDPVDTEIVRLEGVASCWPPPHRTVQNGDDLLGPVLVKRGGRWARRRPPVCGTECLGAPVTQRATVARDSLGIPHVSAGTIEDALFFHGHVTAQGRLWHMDTLRRLAARHLAEDHFRALSASDRVTLATYARGVNFFLESHRRSLPLEKDSPGGR